MPNLTKNKTANIIEMEVAFVHFLAAGLEKEYLVKCLHFQQGHCSGAAF